MSVPRRQSSLKDPILSSPTIFHFIRMSEFPLLNGVTVVISAPFGKTGLSFPVYNILKNYLTCDDVYTNGPYHKKSGFFRHLRPTLISMYLLLGIATF